MRFNYKGISFYPAVRSDDKLQHSTILSGYACDNPWPHTHLNIRIIQFIKNISCYSRYSITGRLNRPLIESRNTILQEANSRDYINYDYARIEKKIIEVLGNENIYSKRL